MGLLGLVGTDWLVFKANRLVGGESYGALALSTPWTLLLGGLWVALLVVGFAPFRGRAWVLSVLASLAFVSSLLFVGRETTGLLVEAPAAARVSLQGGVWLALLAYYIALFAALEEFRGGRVGRVLLIAPGLGVALALILTGTLSDLGLARELASGSGSFAAETWRHLALSGTSVLLAALLGIPAAIWAARQERVAAVVLPTASLLQTLPSLALFGLMLAPLAELGRSLSVGDALLIIGVGGVGVALLLALLRRVRERLSTGVTGALTLFVLLALLIPLALFTVITAVALNDIFVALLSFDPSGLRVGAPLSAPLSELGVRGIGTAPALIALTLYALLPIVRNTYTGIKEVPAAAVEAGRGMGMSPAQILRRVELPLALPLLVEGLRASAVLTIGIATVAYLIGAGGLGTFIQRGIDQVVPDLILLGAVPIIGLALLFDGLLRAVGFLLTPRGVR